MFGGGEVVGGIQGHRGIQEEPEVRPGGGYSLQKGEGEWTPGLGLPYRAPVG